MNEMSLAAVAPEPGTLKDLYQIGEIPPLGHVPASMYAWAIRKERHGEPDQAMQIEVLPTWPLDSHEVLVLVMAAGEPTPETPVAPQRNCFGFFLMNSATSLSVFHWASIRTW